MHCPMPFHIRNLSSPDLGICQGSLIPKSGMLKKKFLADDAAKFLGSQNLQNDFSTAQGSASLTPVLFKLHLHILLTIQYKAKENKKYESDLKNT